MIASVALAMSLSIHRHSQLELECYSVLPLALPPGFLLRLHQCKGISLFHSPPAFALSKLWMDGDYLSSLVHAECHRSYRLKFNKIENIENCGEFGEKVVSIKSGEFDMC